MKKLLCVVFVLFSISTYAQVESFIRTYGIDGFNYGLRLKVLQDTTYMLMGNKAGFEGTNNVYFIHVDSIGEIIKDKVFGGDDLLYAADMFANGDTLFTVTGYVMNDTTEEYDIFVLQVDEMLNELSLHSYSFLAWDFAKAVTVKQDGSILVAAESYSFSGDAAILLLNVTADGTVIWQQLWNSQGQDVPESIQLIGDTAFYVTGYTVPDTGFQRGLILKFDSDGFLLDSLFFDKDSADISIQDITQTFNGNFAAVGRVDLFNEVPDMVNYIYAGLDANLAILFQEYSFQPNEYANAIAASWFSNTVAFAGYTSNFGSGASDFYYILKDELAYVISSTIGGLMKDEAFDCAFALDSSLVMIGNTQSYGTPIFSLMFTKTCKNYFYCLNDLEHFTIISDFSDEVNIHVFPNPSQDIITIVMDNSIPLSNDCSIQLFSLGGIEMNAMILEQDEKSCSVDVSDFPAGVYVLLISNDAFQYIHRLCIVR